jgi:anti-sigma regulatory factor (Ser/Thr protein kinase)
MTDRRRAPDLASRSGAALNEVARLLEEAALRLRAPDPDGDAVDQALDRLGQARGVLARLGLEGVVARPSQPGGSTPATPALVRRVQLPAAYESAHAARDFCRETCRGWSVPMPVANAATDVASELVANASRYGTGQVVLALEMSATDLLVSVWDDGPGTPRMVPYRPGVSEHGVGLQLVNQLSERWGWVEEQGGKWVWARIGVTDDSRLPRPRAPLHLTGRRRTS